MPPRHVPLGGAALARVLALVDDARTAARASCVCRLWRDEAKAGAPWASFANAEFAFQDFKGLCGAPNEVQTRDDFNRARTSGLAGSVGARSARFREVMASGPVTLTIDWMLPREYRDLEYCCGPGMEVEVNPDGRYQRIRVHEVLEPTCVLVYPQSTWVRFALRDGADELSHALQRVLMSAYMYGSIPYSSPAQLRIGERPVKRLDHFDFPLDDEELFHTSHKTGFYMWNADDDDVDTDPSILVPPEVLNTGPTLGGLQLIVYLHMNSFFPFEVPNRGSLPYRSLDELVARTSPTVPLRTWKSVSPSPHELSQRWGVYVYLDFNTLNGRRIGRALFWVRSTSSGTPYIEFDTSAEPHSLPDPCFFQDLEGPDLGTASPRPLKTRCDLQWHDVRQVLEKECMVDFTVCTCTGLVPMMGRSGVEVWHTEAGYKLRFDGALEYFEDQTFREGKLELFRASPDSDRVDVGLSLPMDVFPRWHDQYGDDLFAAPVRVS